MAFAFRKARAMIRLLKVRFRTTSVLVTQNHLSAASMILVISCFLLFFQNCSNVDFAPNVQAMNASSLASGACLFNGQQVQDGQFVTAFQNSAVGLGDQCVSERRSCHLGVLSGSFAFSSCSVGTRASCMFNGMTLLSGQSVTAFQNSTVPAGAKCVNQVRTCNNGALSGSYAFATCAPEAAASCLFNGQTIASGQSVTAFQNSTVAAGAQCVSQVRTCNNGTLAGSYGFASCNPTAAASCSFNGQTIASGQSVVAFQNSTVAAGAQCVSQVRTCNNGTLSGSYTFASCNPAAAASCSFNGQTVASGQSVTAFQNSSVPAGSACSSQVRSCNNGTLSGSYSFASCNVAAAASCNFNGQTIANGQTVVAFQNSSVPAGSSCVSQARVCANGVLSGSYTFASCNVAAAASCLFDGQSIANGQNVTAYLSSTVPAGSICASQTRTCNNGVLSGSYGYSSCSVSAPAACTFDGRTVASGQTITAYQSSSVSAGAQCVSQSRSCNNGVLSGSYSYASCAVSVAASCLFNGQTIASGQSVPAYAASSVSFGSSCVSEMRLCNNGVLSGSYGYANCSVASGSDCTHPLSGEVIRHGQSANYFESFTVSYDQQCRSETRTCNNGVLSGSYFFKVCQVQQPVSCALGNQVIPHGGSVTAYRLASVQPGGSCEQQSITCTNGILSGTYRNLSCEVQKPSASNCQPQAADYLAHWVATDTFETKCDCSKAGAYRIAGSYDTCFMGGNLVTNKVAANRCEQIGPGASGNIMANYGCDGQAWSYNARPGVAYDPTAMDCYHRSGSVRWRWADGGFFPNVEVCDCGPTYQGDPFREGSCY